jgi:hypothetical protein
VFLVEIGSLDNEKGCFASNDYFSEFFGISKTRVSIVINNLVKKGYIKSTIKHKEGSKQILNRVLNICYRGYPTKVKDPIKQKLKDNNTSNNTFININNKNKTYINIFDYYLSKPNLKAHKQFTPAMKKAIDRATNDYKLEEEEIKRIIDRHSEKVEATKNNGTYATKMRTIAELFGQKKQNSTDLICADYLDENYISKKPVATKCNITKQDPNYLKKLNEEDDFFESITREC